MSSYFSDQTSYLAACSDELRKSVLIRNALKTASSFTSSSSRKNEYSTDAYTAPSSSSLDMERWTLMAARAGLDQHSNCDTYDEDEDDEEEDDDADQSLEDICKQCCTTTIQNDDEDESEWFEGLLQEISVEDYQQGSTSPSLEQSTQSHSTSTSSLPSLMLDDEDEDASGDDDESIAFTSGPTQHHLEIPSNNLEKDAQFVPKQLRAKKTSEAISSILVISS